jgi:hypothetical protein
MSYRTYYLRRDGSASPNRPWSDDHIMTVRAASIKNVEFSLPFLNPGEIYARITPYGSGTTIVLCSKEALTRKGMNTRLFLRRDRHGIYETEVIGIAKASLDSEIIRILDLFTARRKGSFGVEIFDGSARTPHYWDEKAGEMCGGETVLAWSDAAHRRFMNAAYRRVKTFARRFKTISVQYPSSWQY